MSSITDMFNIEGRVVVITGGGTGIGSMIAEALVKNGAKVFITGRREDVLKDAVNKLNEIRAGFADFFSMDVSSKEDIVKLVKYVEEREDCVDLLVNNAGKYAPDPASTHLSTLEEAQAALFNLDPEEWKSSFVINDWAPFTITAGFLHLLGRAAQKGDGRGCVINIGSVAGDIWNPWWSMIGYASSKAALNHLTKILAAKLHSHGIRVNTISPGSFETDANDPKKPYATAHPENMQRIPLRRNGTADEIAGTVIYLASRAGAYITGHRLEVEGGLMLVANGFQKISP